MVKAFEFAAFMFAKVEIVPLPCIGKVKAFRFIVARFAKVATVAFSNLEMVNVFSCD